MIQGRYTELSLRSPPCCWVHNDTIEERRGMEYLTKYTDDSAATTLRKIMSLAFSYRRHQLFADETAIVDNTAKIDGTLRSTVRPSALLRDSLTMPWSLAIHMRWMFFFVANLDRQTDSHSERERERAHGQANQERATSQRARFPSLTGWASIPGGQTG